jgi:hypothetical protein
VQALLSFWLRPQSWDDFLRHLHIGKDTQLCLPIDFDRLCSASSISDLHPAIEHQPAVCLGCIGASVYEVWRASNASNPSWHLPETERKGRHTSCTVVVDAILLSWTYRILGDSHRDWLTCDRFCLKPWTTPQSLSSFWASDAIQDSLSFSRTAWARAQSTSAAFKVAPWVCLAVPVCCLNSPDDLAYGPKSAPDAGLLWQVEQFHLFDCRDVACVRHRVRNVMQDA